MAFRGKVVTKKKDNSTDTNCEISNYASSNFLRFFVKV